MPMTDDPRAAAAADGEEHRLIAERRERLAALRQQGEAFPNDFRREDLAAELQQELGERTKDELEQLVLGDRKSTRLNSSHVAISYAVFCLKKKKREE